MVEYVGCWFVSNRLSIERRILDKTVSHSVQHWKSCSSCPFLIVVTLAVGVTWYWPICEKARRETILRVRPLSELHPAGSGKAEAQQGASDTSKAVDM